MDAFFNDEIKEKLASIAYKGIISSVPVVGQMIVPIYEIGELLLARARELHRDDYSSKIQKFHDEISDRKIEYNDDTACDIERDYKDVIESLLRDDECEKSKYYATMFLRFCDKKLTKDEKTYIISTTRSLSMFDIDVLRRIMILTTHDLTSNPLPMSSPIFHASISKLSGSGLIEQAETQRYSPTRTGKFLLEIIINPNEMTPASIGCSVHRTCDIGVIFFYDISNRDFPFSEITNSINAALRKCNVHINTPLYLNSKIPVQEYKMSFIHHVFKIIVYDKHFTSDMPIGKVANTLVARIFVDNEGNEDPLILHGSNDHLFVSCTYDRNKIASLSGIISGFIDEVF